MVVGLPGLIPPAAIALPIRDVFVPTSLAPVATRLPSRPASGVVGIDPPDASLSYLDSLTAEDDNNNNNNNNNSEDTVTVTMMPSMTAHAAAATATATGAPGDAEPTECRLLGSFAILVQLALGGLALLALVYKRWRERPQRPVKIWFFDVSKQVFGSVLVHAANVFMSLLTSGRFDIKVMPPPARIMLMRRVEDYMPNPCSFYLLNLAIDVSLSPF